MNHIPKNDTKYQLKKHAYIITDALIVPTFCLRGVDGDFAGEA